MLAMGAKSKRISGEQGVTYVVEIFVREPVTLNLSYAVNEQSTCCAHETTRSLLGERLLEHAEEGMGIERWVLVGRSVWWRIDGRWIYQGWRAGRRG
jgi:hypothetical protein